MLLREKDKQHLLHLFSGLGLPVEIWAYGSRVNGTAHEGSDLDLIIRSKDLSPIPADILGDICGKIKDSNIPILVELRDWARLPESFRHNIKQQYEVLFSSLQPILNEPHAEYKTTKDRGDTGNK